MTYNYDLTTDYKTAFMADVSALISAVIMPRESRVLAVQTLIDSYVRDIGKSPDSAQLERLSDAILYEELTDPSTDKVSANEYPFLSACQERLRKKREITLAYVDDKPVGGSDTIFYDTPQMRLQYKIDVEVKRYCKINREQPVITYNLREIMGEDEFRIAYPITAHPYEGFRGKEHVDWSLDVRRRDGFKCLKCGKSGTKGMHAHHIEAYNTSVELRYDTDNGATLCKICHIDFHVAYGKGHNTRAQLNEWIGGEYYEF